MVQLQRVLERLVALVFFAALVVGCGVTGADDNEPEVSEADDQVAEDSAEEGEEAVSEASSEESETGDEVVSEVVEEDLEGSSDLGEEVPSLSEDQQATDSETEDTAEVVSILPAAPSRVSFSGDTFTFSFAGFGEDLGFPEGEEAVYVDVIVQGTGEYERKLEGGIYMYQDTARSYLIKDAELTQVEGGYMLQSAEFQYGDKAGWGGNFFNALTYESKEVDYFLFSDSILGSWWSWPRLSYVVHGHFKKLKKARFEELTVDGMLPDLNKAETQVVFKVSGTETAVLFQGDTLQYLLDGYVQGLEGSPLVGNFQGFGVANEATFVDDMAAWISSLSDSSS